MSQRPAPRKRKHRRHTASASSAPPSPPAESPAPEPEPEPEPEPADDMADRYARSRARDEAARAALKPLGPGERPRAVTVAAVVTFGFGLFNLVQYLAGTEIRGQRPNVVGILLFSGLMLAAAWGAWNMRYWAVLGIQALLGLAIVMFSYLATKAESVVALMIALAIISAAGTLFWFLVKPMARIQMPKRPG